MVRRSFLGFVVIVLVLSFPIVFFARQSVQPSTGPAVPPLVTFNGILRDARGQLLQGVVGVTFSLYKDQQGGAPLWTENQNVQFDSEGRYTILLGATQASGLPMDLFTSGQSRWLGVQAQLPGEQEQPRVLLVSVPYALKAADADTIGGMPLSAFVLADPENAPLSSSTSGGNGTNIIRSGVQPRFTGAGSGTSTPNLAVKWTDTNGTLGNSSIQDNGTGVALAISAANNLGIGTTSPISRLHMVDQNGGFFVDASSATGGDVNLGLYNTTGNRQFTFRNMAATGNLVLRDDTAAASRLTIASNGNVGIGTTAPISRLHMVDQNGGFFVDASPAAGGDVNFGLYNTVSNRQYTFRAIGASGSFMLRDDTVAATRLTIDSSGNMGVGTTAPGAKLDVNGTAKAVAFAGNGSALTNLTAANITGTLTNSQTTATASNAASTIVQRDGSGNFSAGTITATAFSGSGAALTNINATTVNGTAGTTFNTRGIVYIGGCDNTASCSVLLDTDDQPMIYLNVIGTMTINSVTCYSDAGSPIINIHRAASANNVLSSNLTCSTTGATSTTFTSGESTINLNDNLDFVMVTAGGTAHRVTVAIKATVN